MPAALFIITARSAKVSLRNSGNVAAASLSFASICESERGSNVLRSCPVAGLMVAIAMDLFREEQVYRTAIDAGHLPATASRRTASRIAWAKGSANDRL